MRLHILKFCVPAALALGLSACATTSQPKIAAASGPIMIDKVDVIYAHTGASQRFADALRSRTRREATRYVRAGAPHTLRIAVTDVHHKNAAASFLIGDGNRASAHVQVVDTATGRMAGEYDAQTIAVGSYLINGMVGAVIAAAQNKDTVDDSLAEGLADDVLERLYGKDLAREAKTRPALEVAEEKPEAAPAAAAGAKPAAKTAPKAAPKPVAPKTAAVGQQQAMAAPQQAR